MKRKVLILQILLHTLRKFWPLLLEVLLKDRAIYCNRLILILFIEVCLQWIHLTDSVYLESNGQNQLHCLCRMCNGLLHVLSHVAIKYSQVHWRTENLSGNRIFSAADFATPCCTYLRSTHRFSLKNHIEHYSNTSQFLKE
jgi:hypothetical protein